MLFYVGYDGPHFLHALKYFLKHPAGKVPIVRVEFFFESSGFKGKSSSQTRKVSGRWSRGFNDLKRQTSCTSTTYWLSFNKVSI